MVKQGKRALVPSLLVLLILLVGHKTLPMTKHLVSDILFLIGIGSLLLGALGVVRNSSFFDLAKYSLKRFLEVILNRPKGSTLQVNDYATYCQLPLQKHKPGPFLGIGAICMLLSLFSGLL